MDLSIVIPCYNEGESLDQLFAACQRAIPDDFSVEVVFVNNGSTDDSDQRFSRLLQQPTNRFGRLVSVAENRGYGYGILAGVRECDGEVIAWTHADLQTDPADVVAAYLAYRDSLVNGDAVVKGRRRGRGFFDAFFTAGMSLVASMMLGQRLSDINAQPKVFHRRFVDLLTAAPEDFSLDVYFLYIARTHGYAVHEHPVLFGDRQYGEAKGGGSLGGKIKLIRRTMAFLANIRQEIREGIR